MATLTTHVLDIAAGTPAAGMRIELRSLSGMPGMTVTAKTNADGRCAAPLLEGAAFRAGRYALTFHVAPYFRSLGHTLGEPPFLDEVVIAFGIADAGQKLPCAPAGLAVELLNLPWKLTAEMSPSRVANSPQTLRFVLDGAVVSLHEPPPTMTVLEYLRDVAGRRGTKEGCAEGDCGACTVVIGELTADRRRVCYRAVNSCIRFLPTLDGKELVTVESLRQPEDCAAHPVQQSMVDHHGSQCGFCTPGFVMSLLALYLNRGAADREQVLSALAGTCAAAPDTGPSSRPECASLTMPRPFAGVAKK